MTYDSRTARYAKLKKKPRWMREQDEFVSEKSYPNCLVDRPFEDCPNSDIFDTDVIGQCINCPLNDKRGQQNEHYRYTKGSSPKSIVEIQ